MEEKKITESSGHYYYRSNGQPCYQVAKKDGSGMRGTNARDMKGLKLVPSVTTIIKDTLPAPGLEAWKNKQVITAVLHCLPAPEPDSDDYEGWEDRVLTVAGDEAALRAELGSRMHGYIEKYEAEGQLICDAECQPMFDAYMAFRNQHYGKVVQSETYLPAEFGYGGRIDVLVENKSDELMLTDYKTKQTKVGKDAFRADEHGLQLAAYAQALKLPEGTRLQNVIISTSEPGRIEIIDWTAERKYYTEWFNILFQSWMYRKKWNPKEQCAFPSYAEELKKKGAV